MSARTTLKKAKVDRSDREFLVGHRHSRGLDVQYDKTEEEGRLIEWSKAINYLTIRDTSFHLQKELQIYRDQYAKQIDELKAQVAQIQKKEYDRDRRRMIIHQNQYM